MKRSAQLREELRERIAERVALQMQRDRVVTIETTEQHIDRELELRLTNSKIDVLIAREIEQAKRIAEIEHLESVEDAVARDRLSDLDGE